MSYIEHKCGNCRFVDRKGTTDLTKGKCKHSPPSVVAVPHGGRFGMLSTYPEINLSSWGCYQFEPRKVKDENQTSENAQSNG